MIDRLLRAKNGSSASEILEKVNQVLVEIGLRPMNRRDTILNDILEIGNRHHVRVLTLKDKDDGRIIRYRYEKLSFSIYNYPLTPQQVEDIKGALNLLMTFKGMPQYKWVEQLCSHFAVANEPLGNKVVYSIHTSLYLDYPANAFEPQESWMFALPEEGVYMTDPYVIWESKLKDTVIGPESCLWTEMVPEWRLFQKVMSRIAAYSEVAWTQPARKDYHDFSIRKGLLATAGWNDYLSSL